MLLTFRLNESTDSEIIRYLNRFNEDLRGKRSVWIREALQAAIDRERAVDEVLETMIKPIPVDDHWTPSELSDCLHAFGYIADDPYVTEASNKYDLDCAEVRAAMRKLEEVQHRVC